MFMRVTRGSYEASGEAEVERRVNDELVPALKALPGFQHYHGGLDRKAHRLVAISIWDTEEHSRAIVQHRGGFEASGVTFDPAETFEVTVDV